MDVTKERKAVQGDLLYKMREDGNPLPRTNLPRTIDTDKLYKK